MKKKRKIIPKARRQCCTGGPFYLWQQHNIIGNHSPNMWYYHKTTTTTDSAATDYTGIDYGAVKEWKVDPSVYKYIGIDWGSPESVSIATKALFEKPPPSEPPKVLPCNVCGQPPTLSRQKNGQALYTCTNLKCEVSGLDPIWPSAWNDEQDYFTKHPHSPTIKKPLPKQCGCGSFLCADAVFNFFRRMKLKAYYAAALPWRGVKAAASFCYYKKLDILSSREFNNVKWAKDWKIGNIYVGRIVPRWRLWFRDESKGAKLYRLKDSRLWL